MLEFTGIGTALRALGFLYWLLALALLVLAIRKGKDKRRKIVWASVVVAVFGFLPAKLMIEQYQRNAFAKEAWAYFKKLCDEKSGEKIYKTFTG
jgi:4-amino-4-deoxy-L-arabinose transferase-like glycosyltransferase